MGLSVYVFDTFWMMIEAWLQTHFSHGSFDMIFHFCNSDTNDRYLDDDFSATKILYATNYDLLVIMAVH